MTYQSLTKKKKNHFFFYSLAVWEKLYFIGFTTELGILVNIVSVHEKEF